MMGESLQAGGSTQQSHRLTDLIAVQIYHFIQCSWSKSILVSTSSSWTDEAAGNAADLSNACTAIARRQEAELCPVAYHQIYQIGVQQGPLRATAAASSDNEKGLLCTD